MNAKDIRVELMKLADKVLEVSAFIDQYGTDVQYEVEFVGGTKPVDTPHLSAGHLAQELKDQAEELFNSSEFDGPILAVEEAEERYQDEYADAVRDLDLGG